MAKSYVVYVTLVELDKADSTPGEELAAHVAIFEDHSQAYYFFDSCRTLAKAERLKEMIENIDKVEG